METVKAQFMRLIFEINAQRFIDLYEGVMEGYPYLKIEIGDALELFVVIPDGFMD